MKQKRHVSIVAMESCALSLPLHEKGVLCMYESIKFMFIYINPTSAYKNLMLHYLCVSAIIYV